jgi:class 3 adenylate cyclase
LRRIESFTRIPLRGLNPDEVHRMLSNISGQTVQFPLAEAVYRQTEGNPLFIQEVIRYAAESGLIRREGGQWVATVDSLLTQIPEGLRDVIGRRLTRLSEGCNRILSVAAVMGRDFSLAVLQEVAGVPEEELLAAIEEAVHVSLLEERSESRDVRYRFTHAFFRQTLYEEMIAPRRLRLHNDVAKALERHYASRLDEHAVELAEHFAHSSTEEDLRKAVHYSELAAQRAAGVYAHGEAARLLEQALQVQEVLDPGDRPKRFELLLTLAQALLSSGEPQRVSDEIAPELWQIAQALGDGERAAVAAEVAGWGLAYYGAGPVFVSEEWRSWMERLDRHAPPESRLRSIADIFMSWTHYGFRRQRECWELRRRALDLTRRLNEPDTLANAMFSFISAGAPLHLEGERLEVAEEFASVPRAGLRPGTLGNILYARGLIFLNAGRRAEADAVWQELSDYAARVGDPYVRAWQMFAESQRHMLDGDLDEAIEIAERFRSSASALGIEVFGERMSAWAQGFALAMLGRAEDALVDRAAWDALLFGDAMVARLLAAAGHIDDARREVRRIIQEREIGDDDDWTDAATLLSLLAAAVLTEEPDTVAMLARRLSGAAHLHLLEGGGGVARQLALAALLLGDPAAARAHLATALDVASRVGNRPEAALVHLDLARMLFEHYPHELDEARRHLDTALSEFQAMKMQPALEEAMRLKMRDQGIDTSAIYTSIDRVAESVQREQPAVNVAPAPDGTVTLMFSDIEDSTVLTEQLGDQRWQELLRRHNALVREQIRAHGGFEVKTMGDGFMVAFQSARRGLECAIAVQRAFVAHHAGVDETHEAAAVRVRIGLHAGEAVREGGDFFGKNVIMASRVAAQAAGGQILVSSILKTLVESAVDPGVFREARDVALKGLAGTHTVYAVDWTRSPGA